MKTYSLSLRILLGLAAGLALGALLQEVRFAGRDHLVMAADALGGAWLDALRMTIVPLVFSLLVVGVGQLAGTAKAGGFTIRVLLAFTALLLISTLVAVAGALLILQVWPAPTGAAAALRASAQGAANVVPPEPALGAWVRGFIPANPIKAAAESEMAPLVIFALAFGMAAIRLAKPHRDTLFQVFDAVQAAMMRIVGWVLAVGPVGVFFLALVMGAKTGFSAVGLLGHYVVIVSIMCLAAGALGLLPALVRGAVAPGRLADALIPVSAMAISTQSSLASLPVMLEATAKVGVAQRVRDLVLPMAVALFRITNPAANITVALYVAHIYGVTLDPGRIAVGVFVAVLVSLAAVGVASAVTFFASLAPILLVMGLPLDLLPLLLAVEALPDFSRTIGNVFGDVGVTVWADGWKQGAKQPALAESS